MARHFLEDSFGPDGIRVTIAVAHAVDRLVRWREKLGLREWQIPGNRWFNNRLAHVTQRTLMQGRWAVEIEADSGQRAYITVADEQAARALARSISDDVVQRGVQAIADRGAAR